MDTDEASDAMDMHYGKTCAGAICGQLNELAASLHRAGLSKAPNAQGHMYT